MMRFLGKRFSGFQLYACSMIVYVHDNFSNETLHPFTSG